MTIIEAVKKVMRRKGAAMTVSEVYGDIIAADLYTSHADNPPHIVANQIRRHCLGLDFTTASQTKHFRIVDDNKYYFLEMPNKVARSPSIKAAASPDRLLSDLKTLHSKYQEELKRRILDEIKGIEPQNFEHFGRKLLQVYGFTDMTVTPYSKDGGIDGYGKLKVGLAFLNVAFQCKRWNRNTVGRPEIDKFRGAIQGQYEQGLLFTTGSFASGAEAASFRTGAAPIDSDRRPGNRGTNDREAVRGTGRDVTHLQLRPGSGTGRQRVNSPADRLLGSRLFRGVPWPKDTGCPISATSIPATCGCRPLVPTVPTRRN